MVSFSGRLGNGQPGINATRRVIEADFSPAQPGDGTLFASGKIKTWGWPVAFGLILNEIRL
ncbi:MAG: hypothetical protein ACREAQ_05090 [Nitrososphaera sp.]